MGDRSTAESRWREGGSLSALDLSVFLCAAAAESTQGSLRPSAQWLTRAFLLTSSITLTCKSCPPFHHQSLEAVDPFLAPLAAKSLKYNAHVASSATAAVVPASSVDQQDTPASSKKTVTDIPFPNVLRRHMLQPVSPLAQGTSLGKVIGFKIIAKGRRGPRSVKQAIDYGKLESGAVASLGGVYVDYGKSFYVDKKGSTGIKVWVTYGSN
ncbi:hypothetical protein BASA60_000887 [Batrachochytrium salamandrivorans]|nr:hypothetical protein BASA60_000887 [Batrachochytrium salamandrivorans]